MGLNTPLNRMLMAAACLLWAFHRGNRQVPFACLHFHLPIILFCDGFLDDNGPMPEIVVTKRIRILKRGKRKKTENYVGAFSSSSDSLLVGFGRLRIGRRQRLTDTSIFHMLYMKGMEPDFSGPVTKLWKQHLLSMSLGIWHTSI